MTHDESASFEAVCDDLNLVLARAEEAFVSKFRVSAYVKLNDDAGKPLGDLCYGRHEGRFCLLFGKEGATKGVPIFDSIGIETRIAIAMTLDLLWSECEKASGETTRRILRAIAVVSERFPHPAFDGDGRRAR